MRIVGNKVTDSKSAQDSPDQAKGRNSRDDQDVTSGRELMLAFQAGNSAAFDDIVYRYQQPVQNFLRRYLRDRDRMEDLTQEVFIRVYKSRERYQPTAKLRTWLFTIATRLALNEIRSIRRKRRVFSEVPDEPEADSPSPFRKVSTIALSPLLLMKASTCSLDTFPANVSSTRLSAMLAISTPACLW